MGWLFKVGASRKDVIETLTEDVYRETGELCGKTLRQCTRGNVLWTVRENYSKEGVAIGKWIGCDLLQNGGYDGWGYKDLGESSGPCYYTCPVSYFEGVPVPDTDYCNGWRDEVRKYHDKILVVKSLKAGETIVFEQPLRLLGGQRTQRFTVADPKKRFFYAHIDNGRTVPCALGNATLQERPFVVETAEKVA